MLENQLLNGYANGITPNYSIDRIHNDLGYHADNIQLMTNRDNVKKYFSYDWRAKTVHIMTAESQTEEKPF